MPNRFDQSAHEDAARDRVTEALIQADFRLHAACDAREKRERDRFKADVKEAVLEVLKEVGLAK